MKDYYAQPDYMELTFNQYKDASSQMERIVVLLSMFVPANSQLIEDHKNKSKIGKRTRRFKITPVFEEIQTIM